MAELSIDQFEVEKNNEHVEMNCDDNSSIIDDDKLHLKMQDLSKFEVKRILRNDSMQKKVAVVGRFDDSDENALVVLEKKTFPDEKSLLEQGFFNKSTITNKNYRNDIYRAYDFFPINEFNGLNATITFPATKKHIEKFLPPEYYMIEETPDMYEAITLPYILKTEKQFGLDWVANILNGTAEADRVIFNDTDEETGFVLVKDLKWDNELANLHLIAIARKPVKTIRDLSKSHLALLKNIKEAGTKAILEKYNLPANQLRIFFHYQPSYYHLHVHFTATTVENAGTNVERAHMLSTVISNIELMFDYYQKATITFRVLKPSLYKPYEIYEQTRQCPTTDDNTSSTLSSDNEEEN